jgi:transposase InsO family protein
VKHITGLPYNPQGQGIIERAHHTLKQYLQKTLLHMYTLVVCPNLCMVASSSQCHSATAHVASHSLLFQEMIRGCVTANRGLGHNSYYS